jgi:multidrug efflux system membrane fusion protein
MRCTLLFLLLLFVGCQKPASPPSVTPPAKVTVTPATKKTVPLEIQAIGTVKVVSTVTIRPRVGGELTEVHFKEGDFVTKGQKLFTIDPRPYETAVKQAEANLARDRALLRGAELDLARAERSGSTGAIAQIEVDAARTSVASSRASVQANEAALHSAKLQLSFTTIYSPLDGRTGEVLVDVGNLLNVNDLNPLVIINQVSPIHVAFSLPEQYLPTIMAAREKGPLKALANLRSSDAPILGMLNFVDNAVDPLTGTMTLKAEFLNLERKLWPGQFVNITLTVGQRPDSIIVPTAAIQTGQQGSYVYIVDADKKAAIRPVKVEFERDGEAIIASGLDGTESVVIEGQLRLAPGTKVEAKGEATP